MDMPSRIELRVWLHLCSTGEMSRDDILDKLSKVKAEHGKDNEEDVRFLLNVERANWAPLSPAELSLYVHQKRKAELARDMAAQSILYGDKA